jgi:hypothetical protein
LIVQLLDGEPDYARVERLDSRTGALLSSADTELAWSHSLDGAAWGQRYGYLTLYGDVYSVDLDTGAVQAVWPEP